MDKSNLHFKYSKMLQIYQNVFSSAHRRNEKFLGSEIINT